MSPSVHPRETLYFVLCLGISVLVYLAMVVSIVGMLYLAIFAVIGFFAQGILIGAVRGSGVRVSEEQFPEVHRLAGELAAKMGMSHVPAIYVQQSGGLLNAFATRFLGRNFVVLYSDVLELAYQQGEAAVAFVIAHELAHIQRGHLKWRLLVAPGMLVPFLGTAYSRSCEYTCDRFGSYYRPDGALPGLLVLAAGKHLYRRVDAGVLARQADQEYSFWIWLAEIFQTHPNLPRRVSALLKLGLMPATDRGDLQMA